MLAVGFNHNDTKGGGMKESTKHCPNCNNTRLVLLGTLNKKYCTDCNTWIKWYLEEGQKPISGGVKYET